MLRHAKSPSKYMSLARLREIQENWYRGRDGQDYEASEVDALIAAKADKLSDDQIEIWTDYCEQLAAYEGELEAEYFADMDSTLLESTPSMTGDGTLPAGACANWSALVAEYAAKIVRSSFFASAKVFTCSVYAVCVHCFLSMTNTQKGNEMKMFKCTLVGKNGSVEKRFYREGDSIKDVLSELDMFQWPAGHWEIQELSPSYVKEKISAAYD